jgi:hypothetical protein
MTTQPCIGPGRFQWKGAAWFGSQLGSTVWMLLGGGLLVYRGVLEGWAVLGCYVIANVFGLVLWSRRGRLLPYPALQYLMVMLAVTSTLSFVVLDQYGPAAGLQVPTPYYAILLIFPMLMVQFAAMEGTAPERGDESDDGGGRPA